MKRQAWIASKYYSELGPKVKDSHTLRLPTDNTLVYSLTLRIATNQQSERPKEKMVSLSPEGANVPIVMGTCTWSLEQR